MEGTVTMNPRHIRLIDTRKFRITREQMRGSSQNKIIIGLDMIWRTRGSKGENSALRH
mgnify:CR=1 FL=1